MKQNTLFDTVESPKKRNVKYVQKESKNGELTVHVNADTAEVIKRYCNIHNLNCKKFVNDVLTEHMKELAQTQYDDLPKEKLIELLKRMDKKHAKR
jgi:uncharacterized protein (DUF1778 family)